MEDRFKFRFWDKNRQKMETYEHNLSSLGVILASNNPDKIPMQCTGYKNKDEVMLYEGDLISYEPNETYSTQLNEYNLFEIKWHEDLLQYTFNAVEYYGPHQPWLNDNGEVAYLGKVVGNIYENPELLKEVA